MEKQLDAGADALVVDAKDHVATALKDLQAGQEITVCIDSGEQQVRLRDDIPFGHKLALVELLQGANICKYGEVIGRASQPIRVGEHVHVHNVEGIRGRGDQAAKGELS